MPAPASLAPPHTVAVAPEQQLWNRVLFGGFLLWIFLSLCFPLYDTDFWWHLKTGEWIWQTKSVPQVDIYTFTDQGQPWIDLHWGFQLLITALYHTGGVNLVILTKAAVITAAVAVAWFAGGRALPVWLKAATWVLPAICITGRGYERPEMLSQLFLAIWLWMAMRVESRPRLIWLLPFIQLVWVNCHALFVLGLVVGASYVIDCISREFAQGRWGLETPTRNPSAKAIIRAGGLVVIACLANPYFEEGAFFPLTLYRKFNVEQEFYSANVGEFRQPLAFAMQYGWRSFKSIYLLAEIGVWCATAATFVWLFYRHRRWSVLRGLLFAAYSHLAWEATRNTNIFAFVSGFIACENLNEAFAAPAQVPNARSRLHATWAMIVVVAGLIVTVITGIWAQIGEANKRFGLGQAPDWFIHDASLFAGGPGFPQRALVANNGQAAVYIYHNAPDRLVFLDGRLEVCSLETFKAYNSIHAAMAQGNPVWQTIFQQNEGELPIVILDSHYSLLQIRGMLTTKGWRLVFADRTAAVFLDDEQADKLSLPKIELPTRLLEDLRELESRIRLIKIDTPPNAAPANDSPGK